MRNKHLNESINVCFFQCYYTDYLRSQALLEGLCKNSVNVLPCVVNQKSMIRYPRAVLKLLLKLKETDVILANFRCWELMPLIRMLTKKPIIYDAHISIWQSFCEERKRCKPESILGRILYNIDKYNCSIADIVVIDTKTHAQYFSTTFGVSLRKLVPVYISCGTPENSGDEAGIEYPDDALTGIFWAGSGIPLQGLDVILDAMRILRGYPVHLRIAGSSSIIDRMKSRAQLEKIENVSFLGRIPRESVMREIGAADVCLGGHYSSMLKAKNVIAGKLYEMIAMKKPVIAGDSPAVRELFTDRENIVLCEMGSAQSLADAIITLHKDPELREKIAATAYNLYRSKLCPQQVVIPLIETIKELVKKERSINV